MRKAPRARSTSPGWIATRIIIPLVMIMQQLTPLGALAAPLNQTGRWVGSPSLTFSATHTVVLREPGTNATKVFLFGEAGISQRMKLWRFFPGDTNILLPTTNSTLSSLDSLPHPIDVSSDLFCSGHATLPDGRMTLLGGTWLPPGPCRQNYTLDPTWRFGVSPEPSPWTASAQMAAERWYATATPMFDGKVLISAGTSASRMIGFGGLAQGVTMDTTWRVLQPLELSAHFSWADTSAAPGDAANAPCQPSSYCQLRQTDNITQGQFPPGRESHVFVGDYSGRAILYGGRRRKSNGDYEVLNDIWALGTSRADDDSTFAWNLMEQVADPSAGLPKARWGCAATWAGVEDRGDTKLLETTGPICFIHGGKDSLGQVLGDLWRGERRLVNGPRYQWVWTRVFAGDATTQRFGHTIVFDPGPPGFPGATRAKLVVYGGWKSDTELADGTRLYAVGVGSESTQPGVWRTLTPSGTAPPARAWHAMTPRWAFSGDGERRYYLFGGESGTASSTASPVAPNLWQLKRPNLLPTNEDSFSWVQLGVDSATGHGPSGRSRPALAYHSEGNLLVTVGGDTNGSGTGGGLSAEIWSIYIGYGQTGGLSWRQPYLRNFHPAPPPIAGMGLFALGDGSARIARSMEQFNSAANSGAGAECGPLFGQWQTVTDPVPESERAIADYPNIFLLPDGRLFNAGPAPSTDAGNARSHYKRFFNLQTKRWEEGLGANDQQDAEVFGSSAMYRPGKVLRAGSTGGTGNGHTQTIDIGAGQVPPWSTYLDTVGGVPNASKPPLKSRTHHNLTVLPNGDVLATGGVRDDGLVNTDPVKDPQIWSVANERWNDPRNDPQHAEWLAPDPYIRNYHSTTVLLPDARILTGGGEDPSPYSDQTTTSVFEPPYLFRSDGSYAPRPRVQNGPDLMPYGRCFTLCLTDSLRTNSIRSIAILRPGAVTHGFDQGQRYLPINFVARESPKRILIQAPANGNLAPPGDYMLFVVDNVGTDAPAVPSVARWVRVTATTVATVDTGDVIAPRGGDVINLHDAGACTDDPSSPVLRIAWAAPADDDTIAFSGSAKAYNLRYALNASPPPDFNNWTAWPTGAPGPPFASEQVGVYGLSANTWYRFALKTSDDHANSSSSSNVAIVKPSTTPCDGGGGGGYQDGGGGVIAGEASLAVGTDQDLTASGATCSENWLFPGALLDSLTTDALKLAGEPRLVAGERNAYVREGGSRGLSLDRARLLAVDHAPGTETVACTDGRFLAGVRAPALLVRNRGDRDLTAEATAAAVEPVYADSGEVLRVSLPAADSTGDVLIFETTDGGATHGGIMIEGVFSDGSTTLLSTVHPRRYVATHAMPLAGFTELHLNFREACVLRFVGRLGGIGPAAVASAALARATIGGSAWIDQARSRDGVNVVVPARDTLQLAFEDVPAGLDAQRDWFMVLDGTPVSALEAAFMAGRSQEEAAPPPARFALRQNVPNPFQRGTRIAFDLPRGGLARFEVFDAQGRRVWAHIGQYEPGRYSVDWNLRDRDGRALPPGLYTYRLTAGADRAVRKMVVVP